MTEGANRAFLRQNPLIEKEFIKRLKRGDTTIELAEYLKNTKWPGSTESGSVSAFIQNTFPKENKQLLLDVGYTEGEVNKMTPAKRTGLKSKIKSYKNVLIPHLKKYDGTVESIALSNVRDQKNLDYLFNNSFKNENDPKILKFIQKDIKKNPKIIQNQIKKFISSGSSDKARVARSITTSALKKQPIKESWEAGEKWISENAPIYDDPDKMRKAFIQQFGKDHPLIKGIKTKYDPTQGFSTKFTEEVLGAPKGGMKLTAQNLKNIFSASIYNFNDDVRDKILKELRIFADKAAPTRYEARARLQTPLLKKFNLNNKIHGPISRLILQDLGEEIYKNIQNNRNPRMDTIKHLQYLKNKVDPSYKKMFDETIKALTFAQRKLWPEAKKQLKIADAITFEHKVPQALIDRGYADPIEYIKVVPTQRKFNEVKFHNFDRPLTNYIAAYEKAAPENKSKWVGKMNTLKDKFNKKFGNYLGDVRIEEIDNKLKLRSLGKVVNEDTDFMSSLKAALKQEKGIVPQKFLDGVSTLAAKPGGIKIMSNALTKGGLGALAALFVIGASAARSDTNIEKTQAGGSGGGGIEKPETVQYNKETGSFVNPVTEDKTDQNALLQWGQENPLTAVAGTSVALSANEVPRSYKMRRGVGDTGPLPSGKGRIRSAIGIGGALKPILTTLGTPAIGLGFESLYGKERLEQGDSFSDILTDPLGPAASLAFMEPLSRGAGVIRDAPGGIGNYFKNYTDLSNVGKAKPGLTSKFLRLGMSPRVIAGASRFLGLPGLALTGGLAAYDAYKNYQNEEGMIYNLFND